MSAAYRIPETRHLTDMLVAGWKFEKKPLG